VIIVKVRYSEDVMGVRYQGHKSLCRSSFANAEISSVFTTENIDTFAYYRRSFGLRHEA
jgi:hypothetical protein